MSQQMQRMNWDNVDFYFLSGESNQGKTTTLKLLYCLFMKNGGSNSQTVLSKKVPDWETIENRIKSKSEKGKYNQNIAVKFTFREKTIYFFTWGDSFGSGVYSIEKGIQSIPNDVDIYIGACHPDKRHPYDSEKIRVMIGKEPTYFYKNKEKKEDDFQKAQEMFEKICEDFHLKDIL